MPEIERPPGRVHSSPRRPPQNADSTPADKLTARSKRLFKLKKENAIAVGWMRRHAGGTPSPGEIRKAAERMSCCGLSLMLRQYEKTGNVRLVKGHFCCIHMLCTLCAAARCRKLIQRFGPAIFADPNKHHYFMTLTLPSGFDLDERDEVLWAGVRKLWMRAKRKGQGPLRNVLGMICSLEITFGDAGWHPHLHCIITLYKGRRVDTKEFGPAWLQLTGGKITHFLVLEEPHDLLEVFKYALKPGELFPPKNSQEPVKNGLWMPKRVEAWLLTRNRRFLRSYGIYRGLAAEPESLLDQEELGDFVEWLLLWSESDELYHLMKRNSASDLHPV